MHKKHYQEEKKKFANLLNIEFKWSCCSKKYTFLHQMNFMVPTENSSNMSYKPTRHRPRYQHSTSVEWD